jgi:hypothetical protein
MSRDWRHVGTTRPGGRRKRPEVGDVVAYARRAWEVRHVDDADPTDDEQDRLEHYVEPWRTEARPYRVTMRRLYGAKHERENSAGDIGLREGPTFHLRRKCWGAAARYEEAWVTHEPGRARSLLTLSCSGTLIVHHDGTAECFGADGSDCPTVYARHRCYSACYLQSHGCGRDCPRAGHPGTRVSGRPADPRAITRVESA